MGDRWFYDISRLGLVFGCSMAFVRSFSGRRGVLCTISLAIGFLLSALSLQTHPAYALSAFDREIVVLSPEAGEVSFHERFNPIVERLSNEGGGTIKLEPGTYVTDKKLYVLSNIRLSGSGREGDAATIIKLADNAGAFGNQAGIVRAKDDRGKKGTPFVSNVLIEDLVIDGNRDNQRQDVYDAEKKYGFYAEAIDLIVRRVTIHSCMGYGFDPHGGRNDEPSIRVLIEDTHAYNNLKDGYALDRQVDMTFRNNVSEDNDRAGINIVTASENILIENTISRNNHGDGIVVQNGSGKITVRNSIISGNERHGIYAREAWQTRLLESEVVGNAFAGVRILGGETITVERNLVSGNSSDRAVGHFDIQVDPYNQIAPNGVVIADNRIRAENAGAVLVQGNGSGVTVRDNVFQTMRNGIVGFSSGAAVIGNVQMSF